MSTQTAWVNVNGKIMALKNATLPITDRGILFGDGVYEVLAIYKNHIRALRAHYERLVSSCEKILLNCPFTFAQFEQIIADLIKKNNLIDKDATCYCQITRGESLPRDFNFDINGKPNYFFQIKAFDFPKQDHLLKGFNAISHEDIRRLHCDVKSTCLQSSALLKHQAIEAQAEECLLHRDHHLTEGSSSNVFMVKDGIVYTPPLTRQILPGITRSLIVEYCQQLDLPIKEQAIKFANLYNADEVWITSTTRTLKPIIKIDDTMINNGNTGHFATKLIQHYLQQMEPPHD